MPTIRTNADGDLTGEPFFAAVRRRHPDVEIVLLAPESPPADEPPTREELTALTGGLAGELAALWPTIAERIEPVPEVAPHVRFGTAEGSVRSEVRGVASDVPLDVGMAALSVAGRDLVRAGWQVGAPDDGVPRVLAERGQGTTRRTLAATYVPEQGSYSVTLSTGSLVVGRATARRMVRGDREAR